MVVRNVVRSPVRAVVQSVFGEGESFHPFQLFTSGAQGAWYDPSDFSTLYQDAAGTTPVTAVEQPVRLMLDRSRGLVLGSELVSNGGFDSATGWSTGSGWAIGSGVLSGAAVSVGVSTNRALTLVVGQSYQITYTATVISGGVSAYFNSSPAGVVRTSSGVYTEIFVASASNNFCGVVARGSTFSGTIDNISVRELPGNHAVAPNDASRPILRARYNLLTDSENLLGNWNAIGGATITSATTATVTTAFGSGFQNTPAIVLPAGTTVTGSALLSGSGVVQLVILDASGAFAGTAVNVTLTATPTRHSVTRTLADANCNLRVVNNSGAAVTGLQVTNLQILTAADAAATGNAYQRIGSATDYDTGPPWRPYLAFDGSDDSMSTSSIDFSGTDKMTVFAGVTKLSDAAVGLVAELSADKNSNAGSFYVAASEDTGANGTFSASFRGSVNATRVFSSVISAPATRVMTALGDISADSQVLRLNGTQVATSSSDQGTGNFGNYPLFIGRRNNTNLPFNGRLYSLAVLGRTATTSELTAMESWIAGKTGVSL